MEKKPAELDKLFSDIGTYRNCNQFIDLLKFIKKFPEIAPFNAMLLHIQKPGSMYVATKTKWEREFNRTIKAGMNPLVILQPFGPVAFVFELSDTEGKEPFPQELLEPFQVKGQISDIEFNNFINSLKCDGIFYTEVNHGSASAGYIKTSTVERDLKFVRAKKEVYVKSLYEMGVNRNHSDSVKFATIAHELGHLYCGHLGTPNLKWWGNRSNLNINVEEFEAESVCWLVCERMGITNPSEKYLSNYLDNNYMIPNISIDAVLKAVAILEKMIKGDSKPRKEIILYSKDVLKPR